MPGFTASYQCNRLVWFERYQYIDNAILREKQIKRWSRAKKIWLIEQTNPTWADLSEQWRKGTADLSTTLRSGRDDKSFASDKVVADDKSPAEDKLLTDDKL